MDKALQNVYKVAFFVSFGAKSLCKMVPPAFPDKAKELHSQQHNILEPVRTPSLWKEMIPRPL
jgi:hypothetical protein